MENSKIAGLNTKSFFTSMRTREKVGFIFIALYFLECFVSFIVSNDGWTSLGITILGVYALLIYVVYCFIMSLRWKYVLSGIAIIILSPFISALVGIFVHNWLSPIFYPRPQNYLVPQHPKLK